MRAASLFGVLVAAKVLVLFGRDLPLSPPVLVALFWQDAATALVAAMVLDLPWRRRPRAGWTLYALACAYIAINVPVARLLSTPLTPAMLRAARGTLADSILHHVSLAAAAQVLAIGAVAAGLPCLLRRWNRRALALGLAALAPVAVLGFIAAGRADTGGLERNAFAALLASPVPRAVTAPGGMGPAHWRRSPFPQEPGEDLTSWRGRARGRNVVLMMLESTGARFLAPYGAAEDPMPAVTALAGAAILFENAYAVYPESIKGLFSVLCSTSPAFAVAPEVHGRFAVASLAESLAVAHYRTALFHSGRFAYLGMDAIVKPMGFEVLEDAGAIGGNFESSFGVDEPAAVERLLAWIDSLPRESRFLAVYLPVAGHHPYESLGGGPFSEREVTGRYRNALHYADAALAQLLTGLRSRGLEGETLVVLAGDHGEAFDEHPRNLGHTFHVYEENMRVPLLIVAPGLIEAPVRVRRTASLLDLAPSILDLLGAEPPAAWQGRSLLDPEPRMALFFTDYSLGLLGLRDGPWKLIHEVETGRSRLFDLGVDPGEQADLSGRFPERIGAYRDRLLGWSAAQRELILGTGR